jgi:hypothetical protein
VLLVFVPLIHAEAATTDRAQYGVVMGEVARNGARRAVFQATALLGLRNAHQAASGEDKSKA